MYTIKFFLPALMAVGAVAQSSSVAIASTVSQSMPPSATAAFNLANTTQTDRFQWCLAQQNQCPLICGGTAAQNKCDPPTLQYTCVCQNGTVPDVSAYILTIPYYVCQETFIQCTRSNPDNAAGKQQCTENEKCGTLNATAKAVQASNTGASSSSASRTASQSASSAAASTSSTGQSDANINTYSAGAFAALLMAGFKILL